MIHYAMTYQEARQAKAATGLNDWIDPGDFRDLPARAALCRTGDGHAVVNRNWDKVTCPICLTKRPPLRDYAAARELKRIAPLSAFHVNGYSKRRKLNQHAVRYEFPDRSAMVLYLSRRRADAWHFDWKGRADDVHLGPVKGAAINVNRSS